jgi:hypothetical protein
VVVVEFEHDGFARSKPENLNEDLHASSEVVNITGNPRVLLAVPVPVPAETHTLWHGYGYLGGLSFSDPGYTRTRTRGG